MDNIFENLTNQEIDNALYGLFLGDGTYKHGSIYIQHTEKQHFYCEWLNEQLDFTILNHSIYRNQKFKTTFGEHIYHIVRISVFDRERFELYNQCTDKNKHKTISLDLLNNINNLGLLLWYLDDGQLHVSFKNNKAKRFGYLNTQSFTYEENILIGNMFKNRFDIDLKIHKDNSGFEKYKGSIYYRLYFNATNFRKFFDVVRPYLPLIPRQFYYKFNMNYLPGRGRDSIEFSEKYNLM